MFTIRHFFVALLRMGLAPHKIASSSNADNEHRLCPLFVRWRGSCRSPAATAADEDEEDHITLLSFPKQSRMVIHVKPVVGSGEMLDDAKNREHGERERESKKKWNH